MGLSRAPLDHKAWLSLGSNIGDRYDTLVGGVRYLLGCGLALLDCSGVYETEPVGYEAQPYFYNMVIHVATLLEPLDLLGVCQRAEKAHRRERTIRWGPRTLDIDILLYDDLKLDLPELTLPHPRMGERAFVLGPLGDVAPGLLKSYGFSHLHNGIVLQIPAGDVKMKIADDAER
jgi:2-amino-4-hydroxy-6-hydroxymethyldihydropteridine diphosphokinase